MPTNLFTVTDKDPKVAQMQVHHERIKQMEFDKAQWEDGESEVEFTDDEEMGLEEERRVASDLYVAWMQEQGWRVEGTGGGCEAWRKDVRNGYVYITEHEDPSIPRHLYSEVDMGLYLAAKDPQTEDNQPVAYFQCENTPEALSIVKRLISIGE